MMRYILDFEIAARAERAAGWKAARALYAADKERAWAQLGFDSFLPVAQGEGYASATAKTMLRTAQWLEEQIARRRDAREDAEEFERAAVSAPLDAVARLRKVPDGDLPEVLGWFASLPRAEAWERFHERFPPKGRLRKFLVIGSGENGPRYRVEYARNVDDVSRMSGEIIVRGTILVGLWAEEKAPDAESSIS